MNSKFLDRIINYDGSQLRPHWILENTKICGDAIVSFIGKCDIKLDHMVDIADRMAGCKIYGEEMLHFIIENFDADLEKAVLRQRLFVSIIGELITELKKGVYIKRTGNDLYDEDAKINISVATASPVSTLIHVGVNIISDNTPVKTKGLKDYSINSKTFAEEAMKRYREELETVAVARCKVRGVR